MFRGSRPEPSGSSPMVEADRQSLRRMFHYSLADLHFLCNHYTARDNLSWSCVLSIGGHVKPALASNQKTNNLQTFYSHALGPTYVLAKLLNVLQTAFPPRLLL